MHEDRKVMTKVDTIAEMSKRYQNGKIYKISSLECDGPCYIGATCTKYLSTRLRKHKENFKTWQNKGCTGKYLSSFELIKQGEVEITLIEEFPCESWDQLRARERYYINCTDCVNKNRDGKGLHESISEYKKRSWQNYYKNNQDLCKERNANRKKVICNICFQKMRYDSLKKHKSKKHANSESSSSSMSDDTLHDPYVLNA